MRSIWTALALILLVAPAMAQTNGAVPDAAVRFQAMQAADAARFNQAAQADPRVRDALDQVTTRLNETNHPAGKMLDETRQ